MRPWDANPYRLVSWWQMEQFAAQSFYQIGADIIRMRDATEEDAKDDVEFSADDLTFIGELVDNITKHCQKIGLKLSLKAAASLRDLANRPCKPSRLAKAFMILDSNIKWEMEDVLFFHVSSAQASFYDQTEAFGPEVSAKFSGLQFDIVEAGNCFAMGRGTASVFHLMRIMEAGVQAFGDKLGVSFVGQKNWQPILDESNKAIRALNPRDKSTVTLCEISANLYSVKLAWRNEVMHPKDTYTLEEATNLFQQVKIFMTQLASVV